MGNRRKSLNGPPPGDAADFLTGEVGPPTYHLPMPPTKTYLKWGLSGKLEITDPPAAALAGTQTSPAAPLVPVSEEVAKLPRAAREAFAARCAARVAPLRAGAASPEAAAALILAAATVETPLRRQLMCIRRDFDRIARRAKSQNWTDDTPVPPDAFGPLWPGSSAPAWAGGPEPPAAG